MTAALCYGHQNTNASQLSLLQYVARACTFVFKVYGIILYLLAFLDAITEIDSSYCDTLL